MPVADDVKIQVEFNPATVKEYRLIGYETRMLAREDFDNDRVDAGEVGAGATVTALYEIAPVGARRSVDPLRYQQEAPAASLGSGELAFLKVRYKRPGEAQSQLLSRPIAPKDQAPTLAAAPAATRWAVAVAGFGQLLRKDPWLERGFSWPQVADLARGAATPDHLGLRSEFIELVADASQATALNERRR